MSENVQLNLLTRNVFVFGNNRYIDPGVPLIRLQYSFANHLDNFQVYTVHTVHTGSEVKIHGSLIIYSI